MAQYEHLPIYKAAVAVCSLLTYPPPGVYLLYAQLPEVGHDCQNRKNRDSDAGRLCNLMESLWRMVSV